MLKNFNITDVNILVSKERDFDKFLQNTSLEPFSDKVIDFLNDLSKAIAKDKRIREFPDVATFGFYCRKANIINLEKKYSFDEINLGRGVVFHVAPSNVPVNFAYSMVSSMLAGNINIVRVPSKSFEQVEIIINAINNLSETGKHNDILERILLVRYDRQSSATKLFSSVCDVRIIWGGDDTIAEIRKNQIPARSFDITFADRYSLCVINADEYINEESPQKIAHAFYNDTYLFDQNACTSPHLVIWLGEGNNVEKSKEIFWDNLYEFIKAKYIVQPVVAVDKLVSFYSQAIEMPNSLEKTVSLDNLIWRIELEELTENIDEYRCTSGYFSEYHASSLSEISKIINRKYQTLAYYGISKDKLEKFILDEKPNGIDRIVPIGRTSDFSLIWDGYDLISVLSRRCEVR